MVPRHFERLTNLAGRRLEYCLEFICRSKPPKYIDECDIHELIPDIFIFMRETGPICAKLRGRNVHDL